METKKNWSVRVKRLGIAAAMVMGVLVTTMSVNSTPTWASTQTWTVTVSGDCDGDQNGDGVATSDWQTVFGVDPRTSTGIPALAPGDTLRIVNSCDGGHHLYFQNRTFGGASRIPNLTGVPTFSDGTLWDTRDSTFGYGQLRNGAHVDLLIASGDKQFVFEDHLTMYLAGMSPFPSQGGFYGRYAVGTADFTSGGNAVTQVFGSQSGAITPFTVTFNGYGARSAIAISGLPPGLTDSNSCVGQAMYCNSPLTIQGTPTQDGTFTVTFAGWDNQQVWGTVALPQTLTIIVGPVIAPSSQTISGTADSAIIPSTAFTASSFSGAVTYAVTSGTLPAGLTLNASTGVISGTPSAASTATVTITATGQTSGTATATVTFNIAAAPTTSTSAPTTTTLAPATTTTVPVTTTTTTVPAPVGAAEAAPTLVTPANQAQLVAEPGEAVALINGQKVAVETVKVEPGASPAQQLAAARTIVSEIASVIPAGEKNPVAVVETDEGAEISGLMVNPEDPNEPLNVPVGAVTLVDAGNTKVLISALNQTNLAAEINPSGVIEVTRGGLVAAKAYGLPGSETGEIVLMSTPRLLKTFTVDKNGSYSGQVPLPKKISFGTHTVVMATKSAKVSLGIKLVRTRMQFRIKRTIGTTIFRNRARIVKKGGGKVTITSSGRCRATATRVKMSSKPGACYITVRQAAKGNNKAINVRFTVQVVKKAIKPKARTKK